MLVRFAKVNWLQRSFLAAIAIAFVGTQSLGLYHRIEHSTAAGWIGALNTARLSQACFADLALAQDGTAEHHCAAIDALALADAPPAAAILLPTSPPAATHKFSSKPPNPAVSRLLPFQARAPPVVLS